MRKLVLALSAVLVLTSFTSSTKNTTILKDIDGTLLQSYPVIKALDGSYTITFTVNANTIVTTNAKGNLTHINLIENGFSNKMSTHTVIFTTKGVDFNSYFESNFDVASVDEVVFSRRVRNGKPKKLME
ncbi:hypothetical protein EGM88_02555 [Aureibaculum marinum]|uniref:DUF3471 domain-containing protein n=1 Tax=Aureibaculum marinum TaxID=2487930 RepID=A0A3N4NUX3_9FLAO|nr:hypothetical protein [Aureibaculum marinum]RPE00163.1 hypothetical protein EGM88_02555 [Aureibaculum marinum]